MFEVNKYLEKSGEEKLSPQKTAEKIIKGYDEGQMKIVKQAGRQS